MSEEAVNEPVEQATEEVSEEVTIDDPKAVLAALDRAKGDAKKNREALEALTAEHEKAKQELEALRASQQDATSGVRDKLLEAHIELELNRRGLSKHSERVRKYLNREGLSLDDDFKPVGVGEAFDSLAKDLPELFDPKRRVGGGADLFGSDEPKVSRNTTEIQLARLQNKS